MFLFENQIQLQLQLDPVLYRIFNSIYRVFSIIPLALSVNLITIVKFIKVKTSTDGGTMTFTNSGSIVSFTDITNIRLPGKNY